MMKFLLFCGLTVAGWLPGSVHATNAAPPLLPPVVVMETEAFEAVGRLTDAGLVWWIDRADSNQPVLAAQLEVELGGKTVRAGFRAEQGDYLIADRDWLQPLRLPGHYPLALTLLTAEDSDLLAGELVVAAPPDSAAPFRAGGPLLLVLGAALAAAFWGWRRRRGGAA